MHITGRRFVVTRGASLIGSHLTQQLLEAEAAAVILFDNYALGSLEVAASLAQDRRVTAVRGDITRLPELLDVLNEVDGVFALAGSLNLSQFVEDQNGPSTSQMHPSWPWRPWQGRALPARSTPPVRRHSADESCAGTERSPRILGGCTC